MSIELHCTQCGKLIKAPDEAGGRHGKCPYCENRVYIPTPEDQIEEIGLAPIDDDEVARERQMREEDLSVARSVMHDKTAIPEGDSSTKGSRSSARRAPEVAGEVVDVHAEVERFVLAMRDSKLDQAERAVSALSRAGQKANDYVQGLMIDEMPPQFENVPAPLMKGFLKTLLSRLG